LTLSNGQICFLADIYVYGGEGGPRIIEVYTSDLIDKWTLCESYECT